MATRERTWCEAVQVQPMQQGVYALTESQVTRDSTTILNPYKCGYCKKTFLYSSHLHTHERTHSGVHVKPYKCSHCEKAFARLQCLQNHEKNTHSGVKPYKCSHCDKHFAASGHLRVHERTHTGERPFQCSHCEKNFRKSEDAREKTHW